MGGGAECTVRERVRRRREGGRRAGKTRRISEPRRAAGVIEPSELNPPEGGPQSRGGLLGRTELKHHRGWADRRAWSRSGCDPRAVCEGQEVTDRKIGRELRVWFGPPRTLCREPR